ncbi:GntR family transcriptional regulator [Tessaracoccus coleopterorum]|nr:hypothetical protein [Tessaracoccus coleopterorum]
MEFDPSSPIWLQLVDEFTRRIVVGTGPPGSASRASATSPST